MIEILLLVPSDDNMKDYGKYKSNGQAGNPTARQYGRTINKAGDGRIKGRHPRNIVYDTQNNEW